MFSLPKISNGVNPQILGMIWTTSQMIPKSFLGVDIGTPTIRVVEVSRWGNRKKLENYGDIRAEALYGKQFRTFEKSTLTLSSRDTAKGILAILEEAKIKTKEAAFSIPDYSSFFTWFELPYMSKEELDEAVKYEARQHIPLPLSEVTLGWQPIESVISAKKEGSMKILLVAVPNEVIYQYQEIASLSQLKLRHFEAEVFGLVRSLLAENEKDVVILADIGAQSTTINIVDGRVLKRSHSFDMAGNEFTAILAKGLDVDYIKAGELKETYGLLPSDKPVRAVLFPLVDLILDEIKKISQDYFQTEGKKVQKVILAGGSALLPGLSDYCGEKLEKPVEMANPFADLFYPPVLEETLKKMGPSYAIAVGLALRGLE